MAKINTNFTAKTKESNEEFLKRIYNKPRKTYTPAPSKKTTSTNAQVRSINNYDDYKKALDIEYGTPEEKHKNILNNYEIQDENIKKYIKNKTKKKLKINVSPIVPLSEKVRKAVEESPGYKQ